MIVRVAPIGERVQEVSLEDGKTVQDALSIAGTEHNGRTIYVNNAVANLDTVIVQEGSTIVLAGKMKGGQ